MSTEEDWDNFESVAEDWEKKLKGKKFVESEAESTDGNTFTSVGIPEPNRIIPRGYPITMDS